MIARALRNYEEDVIIKAIDLTRTIARRLPRVSAARHAQRQEKLSRWERPPIIAATEAALKRFVRDRETFPTVDKFPLSL